MARGRKHALAPWGAVNWRLTELLVGVLFVAAAAVLALHRTTSPALATAYSASFYVLAVLLPLRFLKRRGISLRVAQCRRLLIEPLVALLVFPLVLLLLALLSHTLTLVGVPPGQSPLIDQRVSATPAWYTVWFVAVTLVLAPVIEEFFFRGFLFHAAKQQFGTLGALVLSSVAFASFHPYGLHQRVLVVVLGAVFVGAFLWRRTLVFPMTLHALMNGVLLAAL